MPLLFSYGSLQQPEVQLATFGRMLASEPGDLIGYDQSFVTIDTPAVVAACGRTRHANLTFNGQAECSVPGVVFDLTDDELARVDTYEAIFPYRRVVGCLASGGVAWVYVHASDHPETA
jgi:hypothetical protein